MLGDRYTLGEKLGEGGMGTVFAGRDSQTGNAVAIKILKSEIAQGDMLQRFSREGETLRKLNHPNIVKLLDTVETEGNNALIMELVTGGSLAGLISQDSALKIMRVLEIGLDLADALTRAHRLNIIHRDIKPDNILLAEDGMPRLTDFGVASVLGSNITRSGMIVGTVAYLSPEQLQGEEATTLSDIWAFGVTMFEMLTGELPFKGGQFYSIINSIVSEPPSDLEQLRPDTPVALVDLIYRMLAKNPVERIPSIRLVGAELESLLHDGAFSTSNDTILQAKNRDNVFVSTPHGKDSTLHNLPHQVTPFIGRENELQAVQQLLENASIPLVTIVAQGGMGKTRLSIEAAQSQLRNYPQGVYFIELAPLESSESIPIAVAEAVGYPFQQDGRSPQQQIIEYFQAREQLLIFDNFEHIIDGRNFLQALLKNAPQIKVLVTSRERMNLTGETIYHLEGMDYPRWETPSDALDYASVRLFVDSAQRVRPDFELNADDLPYIARICRLLQGLPLALVLAGTWLELLSVQEIATEIANDIDFLEASYQDIPERQRSMRAVFNYSWRLLTDDEQTTFMQLSLFRGGITREAAQSVANANLRTLQALLNKSILRRDNITGRYEIHELLRQYAQEQLTQSGLLRSVQEKHSRYFASFLQTRDKEIKGLRQLSALQEIEADFENIKSAWRCASEEQEAAIIDDMIEAIYWFCIFRSRSAEGVDLFQVARQVWQAIDEQSTLLSARLAVRYPENTKNPGPTYELGLAIAKNHNNLPEVAFCMRQLGHWQSHSQLNHESGIALLQNSLRQYQSLDDQFYAAMVLDDLGWSHTLIGMRDESLHLVEQSLAIRRTIGDKIGIANALRNLGGAHGGFGSGASESLHDWQEALELAEEIGDKSSAAWNNAMLAAYWDYSGEHEKARPYRQAGMRLATDINEQVIVGVCLLLDALEETLVREDYERAEQLCEEALSNEAGFDVRRMIWLTNKILINAAKHDVSNIKQGIEFFAQRSLEWDHPLAAIILFVGLLAAIDEQNYEKSTEILGVICQPGLPLFQLVNRWGWLQRLQADLQQRLGVENYNKRIELGKEIGALAFVTEVFENL